MASPPRIGESSERLASLLAQISIVYTDLDGTLLGPGGSVFFDAGGQPTLEPADALLDALNASLQVVPVSGRNKLQLLNDVRMLGLKDYIAEAGCLIIHNRMDEQWRCVGDFPETSGTICEAIVAEGADELLFAAFPGRIEYHTPWTGQRECSLLLRGNVDLSAAQQTLEPAELPLRLIDNGIIHPKNHTLVGVEEIHAYHLLPAASSKPAAVRQDLELRSMGSSRAVAIGDSLSDLEIAGEVAAFFLVANALDDGAIAEAADSYDNVFVTSRPMGLGWAETVRAILDAKRAP